MVCIYECALKTSSFQNQALSARVLLAGELLTFALCVIVNWAPLARLASIYYYSMVAKEIFFQPSLLPSLISLLYTLLSIHRTDYPD